ncbi:MAG TPA: hypothetical protein VH280_23585 [Verrucomicrobiae bacterium]|nr:hypothetical protein [Verrucomicrobiae bacterium]
MLIVIVILAFAFVRHGRPGWPAPTPFGQRKECRGSFAATVSRLTDVANPFITNRLASLEKWP